MTKAQVILMALFLAGVGVFSMGLAAMLSHFRPTPKRRNCDCNCRCGQIMGDDGRWQDIE